MTRRADPAVLVGAGLVLALGFVGTSLAQAPAESGGGATTIAANDALAATAGAPSGGPSTPAPSAAPAAPAETGNAVAAPARGAPSTIDRLNEWIGVDTENTQWLRLGYWEGSLGASYSNDKQNVTIPRSPPSTYTTRNSLEYFNIRNQGFSIFDPRLVSGNLGVTLGYDQLHQQAADIGTSQRGTLQGYAFDATFLGEKPMYAKIWADRDQSFSTQPFGGSQTTTTTTSGVTFNLLQTSWLRDAEILPYFDAALSAYQLRTVQNYESGGATIAYDQAQKVINFSASNGGETSDMHLLLEYINFEYPTYPTGAYKSYGGIFTYSGDYGENLNTTWNSNVNVNNRIGDLPVEMVTVNESVDIYHNTDLHSFYGYNLNQQSSNSDNIVSQNALASVSYTLWRHLSMSAGASAVYSSFPNGTVNGANGTVGLDYSRALPWGGSVFASAQGSYAHASDNLSSSEVPVIDETHTAPPVLGVGNGFLLDNPFVVTGNIVIVDTRGGAQTPTAVNVDYTVTADGNRTRILVLPTSRVIQPGDPLVVSYSYQLPTQASYNTSTGSFTAGVDLGWMGLTYSHQQTNAPEVTSGSVTFAGNSTSDAFTASLRGNWDVLQAQIVGNYTIFDSATLAYKDQHFGATASYQPFYELGLTFNGLWYKNDYTIPVRSTSASNARIDLNLNAPMWTNYDFLRATVFALHNKITDSVLPTQTLTQVGANFNYTLGKLTLAAVAQYGQFVNGTAKSKDAQFTVSVNRRF